MGDLVKIIRAAVGRRNSCECKLIFELYHCYSQNERRLIGDLEFPSCSCEYVTRSDSVLVRGSRSK